MPTKKAPPPETNKVEAVKRFKDLAALALSDEDGEPTEEARNAAVKAIAMLAEEDADLIVIPRAEMVEMAKKVEGASTALASAKKAKQEGMMMGGIMGFLFAKGGIGR